MTQKQALLLRYIQWHWWRYGKAPTQKELAAGFEVSQVAIWKRLHCLERDGLVQRDGAKGVFPVGGTYAGAV